MLKAAIERLKNFVLKTHIVFENVSNVNGDMSQKAWGFKIGEDGMALLFVANKQLNIGLKTFSRCVLASL